tara:strand:- start:114 stop:458 length:345 start_codon:yes stop_codon:yes gene_type:complete
MRRSATRAANILPRQLILQIQQHMPEGGKISIPKIGCHERFLLTDDEKLAQNLEITMQSLRLVPTKELAKTYKLSVPAVRTIIRETLETIKEAQGDPPAAFDRKYPLDKEQSDQ